MVWRHDGTNQARSLPMFMLIMLQAATGATGQVCFVQGNWLNFNLHCIVFQWDVNLICSCELEEHQEALRICLGQLRAPLMLLLLQWTKCCNCTRTRFAVSIRIRYTTPVSFSFMRPHPLKQRPCPLCGSGCDHARLEWVMHLCKPWYVVILGHSHGITYHTSGYGLSDIPSCACANSIFH